MRLDPTKTTMLRRSFMGQMSKRFRNLRRQIHKLIVEENAFGFDQRGGLQLNEDFRFLTDDAKITAFNAWLQTRIDEGVLVMDGTGTPWTQEYINSAYKKGFQNAYGDVRKGVDVGETAIGAENEYLRSLAAPESVSKMRLLGTRSFEQLKGVSAAMSQRMNIVMADAISQGWGAVETARNLNATVESLTSTRALAVARTEIIHAHAEGQLDSFQKLGIEQIGVKAEWTTAGDERVCPICSANEGKIFTIAEARGLIPLHVNCRCSFQPHIEDK